MIPPDGLEGRRGASAYSLGICSRVAALSHGAAVTLDGFRRDGRPCVSGRVPRRGRWAEKLGAQRSVLRAGIIIHFKTVVYIIIQSLC